jgi:hypothetical protein
MSLVQKPENNNALYPSLSTLPSTSFDLPQHAVLHIYTLPTIVEHAFNEAGSG